MTLCLLETTSNDLIYDCIETCVMLVKALLLFEINYRTVGSCDEDDDFGELIQLSSTYSPVVKDYDDDSIISSNKAAEEHPPGWVFVSRYHRDKYLNVQKVVNKIKTWATKEYFCLVTAKNDPYRRMYLVYKYSDRY